MNNTVNDNSTSSLDVRKLSVNVITLVSIVGFFIWITMSTVNEKEQFYKEIRVERAQALISLKTDFREEIDRLRNEINQIKIDDSSHHRAVDTINKKLDEIQRVLQRTLEHHEFLVDNVWTKGDLALWCYEVQRKNENFVCPNYETLKQLGLISNNEKRYHRGNEPYNFKQLEEKLKEIEKQRDDLDNNQQVN